jgi:hypothetical protein
VKKASKLAVVGQDVHHSCGNSVNFAECGDPAQFDETIAGVVSRKPLWNLDAYLSA